MSALRSFRIVALLEGASFLVLLFIAMPLKYLAHMPLAVRIVGGLHGLLFLAFMISLLRVTLEDKWPWQKSFKAFVASLLPFGTIVFDRGLREQRDQLPR